MTRIGKITWRSPSNIALVKYWGKEGLQLPLNPSVSMTLTNCYTETTIEYFQTDNSRGSTFTFLFQGERNIKFEEKIRLYLTIVTKELSALNSLHFEINTNNSFPHSSGIASSASSLSSLALCLCQINNEVSGNYRDEAELLKQASHLARLGSGSACRSIYGGWVLWGATAEVENSSDEYAIPLTNHINKVFNNYYDAILVVNSEEKSVNSSLGHKLMETNPYRAIKANIGKSNTHSLLDALKNGNEKIFSEIVEYEAANLHAMFLTSYPPFILAKPETLQIVNKIMQFRVETNLEFSFTLDAGPNIHLLYSNDIRDRMISFIKSDLAQLCENGKWIDDKIGVGPKLITSN